MGIVFVALVALGYVGWTYGWVPAVVALLCFGCGYSFGWDTVLWQIRGTGYTVELRQDGRGKHGKRRWRVGVPRGEAAIDWMEPAAKDGGS